MKYNTTYKQIIPLKETVKEIENIKNEIINFYNSKVILTEVISPLFLEEDNDLIIDYSLVSRDVTLDLGEQYKIAKLLQSHTNWLRSMVNRFNLKANEGLFSLGSFIWRDLPESPVSSTIRNELTIQFVLQENQDIQETLDATTVELYDLIKTLAHDIEMKYDIEDIYPKSINFVTTQMLENEMPNLTFKEREVSFIIDEEAYVLSQAGTKLHSGKIHTFIPPQLYDLKKFNQLVLKDRVNTDDIKVASIAILADGIQLSDQLSQYGYNHIKTKQFYSELMNKKGSKTIEIKINLTRLAMALMAKGHIAETQAGVISEESNIIKTRHKLDKY